MCSPRRVLLSSKECIQQPELRATRTVLRAISHDFFNSRARRLELRPRFPYVTAPEINARLKIAFRQPASRLRTDRVELTGGQGFVRTIHIAIHQTHVPA